MAITNIYKGDLERSDIQKIYKGTTLLYEVVEDEYYNYAKDYYTATNNATLFENAWEHSLAVDPLEISENSSILGPARGKAQYPNGEIEGVIIPQGVTTIGDYAFMDWQSNNQPLVIPNSVTSIGTYAFRNWSSNKHPLVIPDSVTSIGSYAFRDWLVNNQPLVIPNSVTSIGTYAFSNWTSNNQPLVIPDSVTSIGYGAFDNWSSNNQPLVIPDSVTSIGMYAFRNWTSNNQPLVIPDSVTSIGSYAFQNWESVPYVEIRATTPPTLTNQRAFDGQNNAPIYVPNESVDDYKAATNWVNLASRIFPISDKPDEYFYYAKAYYTITNNATLFENAWQDMKDSETVLFDIPLALAAPNQEMGGMTIDLYVGTNGQLQALYDACVNETLPPPIGSDTHDVYYVNNVATYYVGDVSGSVGFPIPLYMFGNFNANENISFIIVDLTPLEMGLGLVLAKPVNVSIPNNNIVIQQGFEFEKENGIIIPNSVTSIGNFTFYYWASNNHPLVIPDSVTSIGNYAFRNWNSNNQPLVIPDSITSIGDDAFYNWSANNQPLTIPNSVTSIGSSAFYGWNANNQPLVIPNSVTTIGNYAFSNWEANNHPLVIPDSVTSIGSYAFRNWEAVPYVEIEAITPPTLTNINAFDGQSDAPIYVPNESVDDYKIATNWVNLASRIFSINDK